MAVQYSIQKMVSDGTLSTVALGIQYLQRNDIYIRIAGEETPQSGAPSGYNWSFVDNTTLKILPVVPNGVEVVVYRRTDVDAMYNIYSQNAQFDEATIDENNQQLLYIAQEYLEQGLPGAGVDTIEYVRDDGSFTYYRMRRTDGSYSAEFTVPSASNSTKVLTREALRRSYAEAGYTLVAGSFEVGGTLVNTNDVLLQERTGKAFSGPAGTVAAGTDPTSGGFVDASGNLLRFQLSASGGASLVSSASGDSVQEEIDAIKSIDGATRVLTKSGKSVQSELDSLNLSSSDKPKGSSVADSRATSLGSNYVSSMKQSDASSTSGTSGFNISGEFVGNGSQNLAAWCLGGVAKSFTCQARLYWGAGVDNSFIGYNSATSDGAVELSTFIGLGFSGSGFSLNDRVYIQTLVSSSELTEGWYDVSFCYTEGVIYCSLCKSGTARAYAFALTKTLANPKNAQIGAYSASDKIRDFRFCSTEASNIVSPPFGGGRSVAFPLTIIGSSNPSGVLISVHLPAGYDPRITHRLAVYCHGAGGTDKDMWNYQSENSVLTALLGAGYVVMAANYASEGWGNQASISQNIAAIQYVKDKYNVFNDPYLVVQSMGGMVGLNSVLVGGIKTAAIAGIYPASNLLWQYQNGFTAPIEAAFSFSGATNFEAATAGYDALNDNEPRDFSGINMKIWHSYADTVVSRSENTDLLKTKVESGGGLVEVITSTGQHGDPSSFDGGGIVGFFSDK